jgi:hypothetical protein
VRPLSRTPESWITKNVRPLTCISLCGTAVGGSLLPGVELAPQLWDVLQMSLGAYIVGRSGEKITKEGGLPWQKPHQRQDGSSTP